MISYAISTTQGRVLGFLQSDTMPVLHDPQRVAHVLQDPVTNWPQGPTPTSELWIANGALYWLETATMDEIKAMKRDEITRQRIAADSDRFTYQGLSIRTADKDMFDLLIADARISKGQGMPPNWPGGWKAIENSYVQIATREEWDAFFVAMYDAGIANFNRSQELKASINAATTPEQVAAIRWNMGEA